MEVVAESEKVDSQPAAGAVEVAECMEARWAVGKCKCWKCWTFVTASVAGKHQISSVVAARRGSRSCAPSWLEAARAHGLR
jgi:hypothetical protein